MKSAPAVTLDLAPSRRLAAAACAVVVLAFVAVAASGMPLALKLAFVVAIGVATIVSLRRFLAPPYRRLARDAGGWQLVDRTHDTWPANLRGHSRLGPLVSLDFAVPSRGRFRCVVDRGAVDADAWRRLVLVLAREPRAATDPGRARSV